MRIVKISTVVALSVFATLSVANAEKYQRGDGFKAGFRSSQVKRPNVSYETPQTLREAAQQSKFRAGRALGTAYRAGKTVIGTGGRAALTAGGVAAVVALAATDASYIANSPEIMQRGLEHAQTIADAIVETGKTLGGVAPQAGAVAGIAAGSYVAAPVMKYMGKGVVRVWMKGGPAVDIGFGTLHYALSLAATQDPSHAAAVGFNAMALSNIARWLTPGAEKLGSSLPRARN